MDKRAIIVVIISIILAFSRNAYSCSCAPLTAQDQMRANDAVFVGMVVSVHAIEKVLDMPDGRRVSEFNHVEVKFRVSKSWKGITESDAIVFSPISQGGSCGVPFVAGRSYLVFALGTEKMWTSICQGSKEAQTAEKELKKLGEPSKVFRYEAGEAL